MLVRSWLCAPALHSKLPEKATETSADIALFDLEDSIPLASKDAARAALRARFQERPLVTTAVRVNSLATFEGLKDLLLLAELDIAPDIVLLPKALLPGEVTLISSLLAERGMQSVQIFAIIETVDSLWSLRSLNQSPKGLRGLIFGAADFAADVGVSLRAIDLRFARQEIVLAARRFGVAAIDSPCFHLRDQAALEAETRAACDLGFAGKIAIHPDQIATINKVFTPSSKALDEARSVIAAAERQPDQSILRRDDEMVGPPLIKYARKVLSHSRLTTRR
jgi:citrate lyase beta subunit